MIFVFYILAAVLVWFSYKSFRGGIEYLNYFKRELAKPPSNYTPMVSVIAPCKGIDEGIRENLQALVEQDYSDLEIIFVVDDSEDPAVSVINEIRANAANTKLVVANKATTSAQKAESLREAVLHADKKSEAFVFVDSDARTGRAWLRSLVAPLRDESIGAATGYRWFVTRKPTFSSEMLGIWNASVASSLGSNEKGNFCWGGSMAIRRDTFERLGISEIWKNVVSDDFAITRAVRDADLRIYFVPRALASSFGPSTMRQLIEFTNRQMKITRVYAQHLWLMSFFGSGLFVVVMISAFAVILLSSTNSFSVWASIAVIVAVTFFSIGKSTLRLFAVRAALPQYDHKIRRQFFSHNTVWILTPFLFFINCGAALFSRRITWRGTEYEMISPRETRIVSKKAT